RSSEELREQLARLRRIARQTPSIGQCDLRDRYTVSSGLLQVAGAATHERGQLLCSTDLSGLLVAQRPATIAENSERAHSAALQLLASHRLDRVSPDLLDSPDLFHPASDLSRCRAAHRLPTRDAKVIVAFFKPPIQTRRYLRATRLRSIL